MGFAHTRVTRAEPDAEPCLPSLPILEQMHSIALVMIFVSVALAVIGGVLYWRGEEGEATWQGWLVPVGLAGALVFFAVWGVARAC